MGGDELEKASNGREWESKAKEWLSSIPNDHVLSINDGQNWVNSNQSNQLISLPQSDLLLRFTDLHTSLKPQLEQAAAVKRKEGEEEERYLCLVTRTCLVCFDLDKAMVLNEKDEGVKAPDICVDVVNFIAEDSDYPVPSDLTPCKFPNDPSFYLMAGGRYLSRKKAEDPDPIPDLVEAESLYKLVSYPLNSSKEVESIKMCPAPDYLPRMESTKFRAVVEQIGKKIYVLHGRNLIYHESFIPEPSFEAFDTDANKWVTLKPPPFYDPNHDSGAYVFKHGVIGYKIFIALSDRDLDLYIYDTQKEEWQSKRDSCRLARHMPFSLMHDSPRDQPLHILISLYGEPTALLVDSDGLILDTHSIYPQTFGRFPSLHKLFSSPFEPIFLFYATIIPLKSRGRINNRFCAVSADGHRKLYICFFSVYDSPNARVDIDGTYDLSVAVVPRVEKLLVCNCPRALSYSPQSGFFLQP